MSISYDTRKPANNIDGGFTFNIEVNAELAEDGSRVEVRFPYDAMAVKAIKRVPGARFLPPPQGGPAWLLPVDLVTARGLREQFGMALILGPRLKAWGKEAVAKEQSLQTLATAEDADLPNVRAFDQKFYDWLRPYQRAGIQMMAATNLICADQPGLGKTTETIGCIIERGNLEGSHMIVAPKTSLDVVWEAEIEKWVPDIPVIVVSGDDDKETRRDLLDLVVEFHEDEQPFFLVLNPAFIRFYEDKDDEENMQWVKGKKVYPTKPVYPELFDIDWDTVVFDEYHKMGLSNNKTKTFQAANELKADHRILLSGTPMGGKPVKLWGALHFLEPERFTSKWRWIDQWLLSEDNGYGKVVQGIQPGKEDAFWNHIAPYMVRRTKDEVLKELPPKQIVDIWCDMTPKQKNQYVKFATDAELKIEEENLSATGILAEYMRLKQFAGAHQKVKHMANGDLKVLPTFESGKLPHIMRILEERGIGDPEAEWTGEQVVIGSQFSAMADMIYEFLTEKGIRCGKITGAATQNKRTELVRSFQSGELQVMVMSTTAGGVAITLDKASTVILVDETWNPDDQEQFEDRVHRASRIHQVVIYYLRSRDSIEEYIQNVVLGKAITNREILDLRRQGFRAI